MKAKKRTNLASTLALPLALSLGACAQEGDPHAMAQTEASEKVSQIGAVEFRLARASELPISEIQLTVANAAGKVLYREKLAVNPNERTASFVLAFPAGLGYSMTLTAQGDNKTQCSGSALFNVLARQTVELPLTLRCSAPGQPSPNNNGNVKVEIDVESVQQECPEISMMAALPDGSTIGRQIRLRSSANQEDVSYFWSASSGEFSDPSKSDTVFRCEKNGPVTVTLAVQTSPECRKEHSLQLVCNFQDDGGSACADIVAACEDAKSDEGPLSQCLQIGQAGDNSRCSAERQRCVTLCRDTPAGKRRVEIKFEALVDSQAFDCRKKYTDLGSTGKAQASPNDFRFFLHELALIKADGSRAPVKIEDRGDWQGSGVALVDFEGGPAAGCFGGSEGTNRRVTGTVEEGDYVALGFRTGLPAHLNHLDPTTMKAPLNASGMFWSWMSGFKFIKAELGSHVLHVGSTACGSTASNEIQCAKSNRSYIELDNFNAATDIVVADLAAIFSTSDLSETRSCHSSGSDCGALFESVGLNFEDGSTTETQRLFRVK